MIEFLNLLIDFRKLFCADNYIIKLYNYIALEPPGMRHIRKITQWERRHTVKNSIKLFLSSGKKSAVAAKKLLEQMRDDEDYRSSVISHDIWTNSFETSVPVRRIYDHVHSFLDVCDISDGKAVFGGKTVFLLNEDEAKIFYLFGGEAHFAKGTAYRDENGIICESADGFIDNIKIEPNDMTNRFGFAPTWHRRLKYDYFLYSIGRRAFYNLKMPKNILDGVFDIELVFDFKGLNLQVFSGGKLINDYFNIDGKFVSTGRTTAE